MFNKKTALLILGLLSILILIVILVVQNINKDGVKPAPITIFTKPSPTPTSPSQIEELLRQTEADINVSQLQNQILREYPWYNKLPLQENNYFVLFDLQKKSLRGKIYPQKSSSVPVEDQVKSYQQEILKKLKKLGIDTSLYPIEWVINPE